MRTSRLESTQVGANTQSQRGHAFTMDRESDASPSTGTVKCAQHRTLARMFIHSGVRMHTCKHPNTPPQQRPQGRALANTLNNFDPTQYKDTVSVGEGLTRLCLHPLPIRETRPTCVHFRIGSSGVEGSQEPEVLPPQGCLCLYTGHPLHLPDSAVRPPVSCPTTKPTHDLGKLAGAKLLTKRMGGQPEDAIRFDCI